MMIVNSPHYALNGDYGVGCRQQKQQQQRGRSKVKGQQYGPTMTSPNKHSGANAKIVSSGTCIASVRTTQEAKLLGNYNIGGHRTPPKALPRSPSSRSSPGSAMAAAYAGAKFSAAPPSPHALPKPPVSWVHCGNNPPLRMKFDNGGASGSCDPMAATAANAYGNLISNQLKLLLNMQA